MRTKFPPSNGRVAGALAIALSALVVGLWVVDRDAVPLSLMAGALLFGVLAYAAAWWPAMWATEHDLVMRNVFTTAFIPLAAISEVVVTQLFSVRAGDHVFRSSAVGKTLGQTVRGKAAPDCDFVESQVRALAEAERSRLGVRAYTAEQDALAEGVRVRWIWPNVVLVSAAALFFAVSLIVG